MPDRAVVDDDHSFVVSAPVCEQCGDNTEVREVRGTDGNSPRWWCRGCNDVWECHTPRAVVAISEDRQWLVVRCERKWGIFGYITRPVVSGLTHAVRPRYESYRSVEDTGQSANEVLAAFLADQEATNA